MLLVKNLLVGIRVLTLRRLLGALGLEMPQSVDTCSLKKQKHKSIHPHRLMPKTNPSAEPLA